MADDYRAIANRIAGDIAAGRLPPGAKLPPQRQFARRHQIASSTAARVYGELVRRGLAIGEVGRGTFVRAAEPRPDPVLAEPAGARVDLELNFTVLPEQPALLTESLSRLTDPGVLADALRPIGVTGNQRSREAASTQLARGGWAPDPHRLLFAGNGRQAIAAAIAALVPVGDRLGVEPITYPVVKSIAARLGVTLVPLTVDEHGVSPRSLPPVRAIYLQPALHNPLGTTMPDDRRAELAHTARKQDLYLIEDGIYSFLRGELPPLAAQAPDRTIVVDSMSKRLAPGLTLGFVAAPDALLDRVAGALRSGGWAASGFALDATTQWITDGAATAVEQAKRRDALARQEIVAQRMAGFTVRADPRSYHCWWELPDPWRAETFVAAASRRGIAVTPAAAFTVGAGHSPNAVRLALSSPSREALAGALDVLAGLARSAPEDASVD